MFTKNSKKLKVILLSFIVLALFSTLGFFIYTITLNANSLINLFALRLFAGSAFAIAVVLSLIAYRYFKSYHSGLNHYYDLAYYSTIEGIPNRNYMQEESKKLISTDTNYAFVTTKIKKFDVIKNVFGAKIADLFLKHIASSIASEIKTNEVVAYFHSDIFFILISYDKISDIEARLSKIDSKIASFSLGNLTLYSISSNFGIYEITDKELPFDDILTRAMYALGSLDEKGESTSLYFYNDEIKKLSLDEHEIYENIDKAIANNEIKLYILPKYSMRTGKIAGAEALSRWHHKTKGVISPDDFISTLEKYGYIEKLDLYMLEKVCIMLRKQLNEGMEPAPISLNQSRVNLYKSYYFDKITNLLAKYDIPTRYIEFELSESYFVEDEISMCHVVDRLHSLGFKVSVDNFCEDTSSMNMFNSINIDEIKIDEKFFIKSTETELGETLISSIIAMSNNLGIAIVAEGVEKRRHIDMLKQTDCHYAQGYYMSKPVPEESYTKMLKNNKVIIF